MGTGKVSSADTSTPGVLQAQFDGVGFVFASDQTKSFASDISREIGKITPTLPEPEICLVNDGMGKNSVYRNTKSS